MKALGMLLLAVTPTCASLAAGPDSIIPARSKLASLTAFSAPSEFPPSFDSPPPQPFGHVSDGRLHANTPLFRSKPRRQISRMPIIVPRSGPDQRFLRYADSRFDYKMLVTKPELESVK